jgi:hypothetical protein
MHTTNPADHHCLKLHTNLYNEQCNDVSDETECRVLPIVYNNDCKQQTASDDLHAALHHGQLQAQNRALGIILRTDPKSPEVISNDAGPPWQCHIKAWHPLKYLASWKDAQSYRAPT